MREGSLAIAPALIPAEPAKKYRRLDRKNEAWKRRIHCFGRPAGFHSHSLTPYVVKVVQQAMCKECEDVYDAICTLQRISDPGASEIRAGSRAGIAAKARCSQEAVSRWIAWLLDNHVIRLWSVKHGGKDRRDPRAPDAPLPSHYVIRRYPDVLAEWRAKGQFGGYPVCLGRNGRTGAHILTQAEIDAWYPERLVSQAAAAAAQAAGGVARKPTAAPSPLICERLAAIQTGYEDITGNRMNARDRAVAAEIPAEYSIDVVRAGIARTMFQTRTQVHSLKYCVPEMAKVQEDEPGTAKALAEQARRHLRVKDKIIRRDAVWARLRKLPEGDPEAAPLRQEDHELSVAIRRILHGGEE